MRKFWKALALPLLAIGCILAADGLAAREGPASGEGPAPGEENIGKPPITPDVPMQEFQNPDSFVPDYNFDAAPKGLFRSIQFTEGFEEELGFRRTHEIVPVNPTDVFRPDSPTVYVVFSVFPHYESFQVQGVCYPEDVKGLDPKTLVAKDSMYLALEDESGYLTFLPPPDGWKPGKYKVEIHVGWQVNQISLLGTMRFTVAGPG